MKARAHGIDQALLLGEPHQADAKRKRGCAAVGGDHILGEVGRDHAEQATHIRLGQLARFRRGGCLTLKQVGQ
jgi:hypothetical protein